MTNILIFGSTGLVGKVLIDLIESRNLPVNNITLVASDKSKGKIIKINEKNYNVINSTKSLELTNLDIIFFCASSTLAKQYCPKYLENNQNCFIIDNSSHYRLDPNVDIVIPPINKLLLKTGKRIISNSNCTTSGLIMAIYKLHKFGFKNIIISSFQSVSGSGYNGLNQLLRERLGENEINPIYPHNIHNNVIPLIGKLNENGVTSEEEKLINETKKILKDNSINITATCVRIPIEFCHSLSVTITFKNSVSLNEIKSCLNDQKELILTSDIITPLDIKNKNDVFVCRLRKDTNQKNTYNMFIIFNNLFRGASLNSIQIAEELIKLYF